MKQFRVKLKKSGNGFIVPLPKLITDMFQFSDGDEIEISIHPPIESSQASFFEKSPGDIRQIDIKLSSETHSMNMYNRIYVPVKYRFFFPPTGVDFILQTNSGNIRTDLTRDGFIKKNTVQWFSVNGPLEPGGWLTFVRIPGKVNQFQLEYRLSRKHSKESPTTPNSDEEA